MPALADALLAADPAERDALLRQAAPAELETAIATLGHRHEPAAAEVLSTVESVVADRALRKAARRELHRLRSSGIAIPQAPGPVAAVADPSVGAHAGPRVAVTEAWATDIDPTGSRAVWLLGEPPLGGAWFGALVINERKGVLDLSLVDTTRKRFQRELDARARDQGTWLQLPGDYAWRLVREAVDAGRESGSPQPPRYRAFRDVFGEAPGPPERALIYETISPLESTFNPDWLDESHVLVREPEVMGWHIPLPELFHARALEAARAQHSPLLVPGNTPEEQALHVLAEAASQALTPAVRRALRRRLEETAYVFASTDRLQAARRAVAAARAFEDGSRPAERSPFTRVLLESGLARLLRTDQVNGRPAAEVLVELIERATDQSRASGRPTESRPSGLILPR